MGMQRGGADGRYHQDTEIRLLAGLLPLLENRDVVDVGAERGSFIDALLTAGAATVYAFEPFPGSVEALRRAFGEDASVRIFDLALGARDGPARLRVVEDKTGRVPDAYHSLVAFEETATLRIVDEIEVRVRTLDSLVAEGVLPPRVGILKVDTERGDLDVLRGMGRLSSSVVMLEFWDDLPETVGPSPYLVADAARLMADRGYSTFVVVKRRGQVETLVLNAEQTRPGDWGNVVFVHDTVLQRVSGPLFRAVADAQADLVDRALYFAGEAEQRQAVIDGLTAALRERLGTIEHLNGELERKEAAIVGLAAAAGERDTLLARIEQQAEALAALRREAAELRVRAHRQSEDLRGARSAFLLLSATRVYRLMRALGRWGWLEHRIRRVLR